MTRAIALAVGLYLAAFAIVALAVAVKPARAVPESVNREGKSDRAKAPGLDLRVFATCRSA